MKAIETQEEYEATLKRIGEYFESDFRKIKDLIDPVIAYEDEHFPI